ncbi:MAG: hypothetical protein OEV40_29105 [Acidimicrobiia bacterium]|nr:hypothetical protein [Acidimicrobiia bacterium]
MDLGGAHGPDPTAPPQGANDAGPPSEKNVGANHVFELSSHRDEPTDGAVVSRWLSDQEVVDRCLVTSGRIAGRLDLRNRTLPRLVGFEDVDFIDAPDLAGSTAGTLNFRRCTAPGIGLSRSTIGHLVVRDCDITGTLRLRTARLEHGFQIDGTEIHDSLLAIDAAWLQSDGPLDLASSETVGRVDLLGATVKGDVWLNRVVLNRGADTYALRAKLARIDGNLRIAGAVRGEVRLGHVAIAGDLDLRSCTIRGYSDNALSADSAEITGRVRLGDRFRAEGLMLFVAADVRDIDARGSRLVAKEEALNVERATARNDVDLSEAIIVGGVNLSDAAIGGALRLDRARLTSPDVGQAPALNAENTRIGGNFVATGTRFEGGVRCPALQARHVLIGNGTSIARPGEVALALVHARIDTQLRVDEVAIDGGVTLEGARVAELRDSPAAWRSASFVDFAGMAHDTIALENWTVDERLELLARRPTDERRPAPFASDSYSRLAAAYRQRGELSNARKVLIEREDIRLRTEALDGARDYALVGGRLLLKHTVAHGYRPGRAFWFLAATILALALLLAAGPGDKAEIFVSDTGASQATMSALVYAADTVLPIIDLGEADVWRIDRDADNAGLYLWALRIATALGWILSTLLLVAITRLTRSESDGG